MQPPWMQSPSSSLACALLCVAIAALAGCYADRPATSATSERHPSATSTDRTASPVFALCPPGRFRSNGQKRAITDFSKKICRASELVEEDRNGFELWQTPEGRYWTVAKNFGTTCELLAEQQVDIYRLESPMGIRHGDIVLDGGAHFGVFTRRALDLGAKLVVAIEIAPENIECLRRTFSSEIAEGRVIVYPKGIWDKDDELVLERSPMTWAHHVVEGGKDREGPRVPLTTIDKIVSELKLPRVDFIKMDIEGAERNALVGAAQTLATFRPRMAVASYHEDDDLERLPPAVLRLQPEYEMCLAGVGAGWGNLVLRFQ